MLVSPITDKRLSRAWEGKGGKSKEDSFETPPFSQYLMAPPSSEH